MQEDRRFTEYCEEVSLNDGEERAYDAGKSQSGQNKTKSPSKETPIEVSKVSYKRTNEKAYTNDLKRDSFDSDKNLEKREGAETTPTSARKPGAYDYTKNTRGYGASKKPNESQTNPVPFSLNKNVPLGSGNTVKNNENHPSMRFTQDAMAIMEVTPGRSARHQAEELPLPPKHPLARSFVHEISALFGDLNEKGSKTDIERRIEEFDLADHFDVLLCLVHAYVVTRDTKNENVRHRRPDGKPNRMPLFTRMFEKFAQALGPGSKWQYTHQQMFEDIAADGRLELWVSEHQAELTGEMSDQAEASQPPLLFIEECTEEEREETFPEEEEEELPEENKEFREEDGEPVKEEREEPGATPGEREPVLTSGGGWKTRELAYDWAVYVVNELAANGYEKLEVSVFLPADIDRYQVSVQHPDGGYYCLMCGEDIHGLVFLARNRKLFLAVETDGQAVAGGA